jgi:hypothetical protein
VRSLRSEKTPAGDWLDSVVPDRTTVRHGWAREIEVGSRANYHDAQEHPYRNWGYRDALDYTLDRIREKAA